MPLTAIACKNATPNKDGSPRKLADSGGLYLLVTQSGRYWRWDYRQAGKRKTMALGVYPEVSVADARAAHFKARAVLRSGTDPMSERKAEKIRVLADAGN